MQTQNAKLKSDVYEKLHFEVYDDANPTCTMATLMKLGAVLERLNYGGEYLFEVANRITWRRRLKQSELIKAIEPALNADGITVMLEHPDDIGSDHLHAIFRRVRKPQNKTRRVSAMDFENGNQRNNIREVSCSDWKR